MATTLEDLEEATGPTTEDVLTEALGTATDNLQLMSEQLRDLELQFDDLGWQRLELESVQDFTRDGLARVVSICRIMVIKNPLIRRAANVQAYYVFGQGVNIRARDPEVNEVIQEFLDDERNAAEFSGAGAQYLNELALQHDANIFFTFTTGLKGEVRIRSIIMDQIRGIIRNPDDAQDVWFYRREWQTKTLNLETGEESKERSKRFYADWRYEGDLPKMIGSIEVDQEARVFHVSSGGLKYSEFGIPDLYAAIDWARAYKQFLTDWASIARSLQRVAYKMSGLKKKGLDKVASKMGTELDFGTGDPTLPVNRGSAGGIFAAAGDVDLAPISKAGAIISADGARALRTMVAAATDIPDTILAGDPDMGNLATAKTLDRPTELAFKQRQTLHTDIFQDVCKYVVIKAIENGKLQGTVEENDYGTKLIVLGRDVEGVERDSAIDVSFPPILEHDIKESIGAIVSAATLDGKATAQTMPLRLLVQLLLSTLGVDDIDSTLDLMFPDGEEPDPAEPPEPDEAEEAHRALVEAAQALKAKLEAGDPAKTGAA